MPGKDRQGVDVVVGRVEGRGTFVAEAGEREREREGMRVVMGDESRGSVCRGLSVK